MTKVVFSSPQLPRNYIEHQRNPLNARVTVNEEEYLHNPTMRSTRHVNEEQYPHRQTSRATENVNMLDQEQYLHTPYLHVQDTNEKYYPNQMHDKPPQPMMRGFNMPRNITPPLKDEINSIEKSSSSISSYSETNTIDSERI